MTDFWNTQTKRYIAIGSMSIGAWHILADMTFANLPKLPSFFTNPIFGKISLLTVAGFGIALSVYHLIDGQING